MTSFFGFGFPPMGISVTYLSPSPKIWIGRWGSRSFFFSLEVPARAGMMEKRLTTAARFYEVVLVKFGCTYVSHKVTRQGPLFAFSRKSFLYFLHPSVYQPHRQLNCCCHLQQLLTRCTDLQIIYMVTGTTTNII
jgi:hypothetical protein